MNRRTSKLLQAASQRIVPPNYRNEINVAWHRNFSWRERFQILFGYAITCELTLWTEHKPGKWHPTPKVTVTKQTDPEIAAIECSEAPQ